MPTLDDLLAQTMFVEGVRGARLEPVPIPMGDVFATPRSPSPQTMADVGLHERADTAMRNFVWRFRWDPAKPGTFLDLKLRTRGMGMDYGMLAEALTSVEFSGVTVEREEGGQVLDLPLETDFLVGAWSTRTGEIAGSKFSPLWRLEAKLDASMLACFAYQLDGGVVKPLTRAEIDDLGETLIPVPGKRAPSLVAGEVEAYDVCIGPARYIVAVELVLCRERPDFVPGSLVGFCRIHPHAFVWSNEDLVRAEVSIDLVRPAKAMECDPAMEAEIGPLAVTDTNDTRSASGWFNLPIPYTDNLYDYYVIDPFARFAGRPVQADDHPMQQVGEVTMVDPRRPEREIDGKVKRRTPLVHEGAKIRKVARQGQIDNVHLAAKMKAEFSDEDGKPVVLEHITMLNQCLHDCVHMHVRWAEFLEAKMMRGWGRKGPFTVPGAPAVPHNQVVFASFPSRHALRYRAVAEHCKAGEVQIFCHHGLAYAVDEWPDGEAGLKILGLHGAIAAEATLHDEPFRAQIPFGWVEFYFRVRWTGSHGHDPVERLTFDLERCMR